MRIDAINKVNQLYQATKPKKAKETSNADIQDKYEVSKTGKDYQTAKMAIKTSPDIREDRISQIKMHLPLAHIMYLHRK